jgi:hypothetical protein
MSMLKPIYTHIRSIALGFGAVVAVGSVGIWVVDYFLNSKVIPSPDSPLKFVSQLPQPGTRNVRKDYFGILLDYRANHRCSVCRLDPNQTVALEHFQGGRKILAQANLPGTVIGISNPIPSQQVVVSIPVEDSNAKSLKIIKDLLKD